LKLFFKTNRLPLRIISSGYGTWKRKHSSVLLRSRSYPEERKGLKKSVVSK